MSTESLIRIDARIKLTVDNSIVIKRTIAEPANGATLLANYGTTQIL